MRRALIALVIASAAFIPLTGMPTRPPPAEPEAQVETHRVEVRVEITQAPDPEPEDRFDLATELFALTNAARGERGLAPLGWWTAAVHPAAHAQTDRMVDRGKLFHNPGLEKLLYSLKAQTVAENVGMGPSVAAIQRAFMKSKGHRENILDPTLSLAAVWAVQDLDGTVFVTVVFGRPLRTLR